MQENKIIQDEINTDNKENNSTGRKTAGKKICWWQEGSQVTLHIQKDICSSEKMGRNV